MPSRFQYPATKTMFDFRRRLIALPICGIAIAFCMSPAASGEEQSDTQISAADRQFFEAKIRPVLVKHCYGCHSADAKEVGGKLLLDTRESLFRGGQSGPAVVPGDPDKSLLVQAVRYEGLEMPPEQPLPEAAIHDLVTWVKQGVPDPRTAEAAVDGGSEAESKPTDPSLWSFQPVENPPLPKVTNQAWCFDPLDHFVLAKLESAGLAAADDAEPAVLLRRLFHDLVGLPPSMTQVQAFVAAYQQDRRQAVAQWVEKLLAMPQFGERWGRHWLDVARYGESNGNDGLGRNPTFPHAWRYRDYVIDAFNRDVPYDRFLTEQIAGDLLPAASAAERDRQLIATGFLALCAKPAKAMNANFDMDVVDDQINVVSTAVMGLSVACARCHDHKHDPIPTRDYYALAGIFKSSETLWGAAANERLTAPPTSLHELATAEVFTPPTAHDASDDSAGSDGKAPAKPQEKSAKSPAKALAMGVRDREKPADCKIHVKGESSSLGPVVPRGFLSACDVGGDSPPINAKQSGRLELATWLTSGRHPQTARVLVNRVWLHLFGQAIVDTPDDFGVYGSRPTHPGLLDHLACRLVDEGWSVKRLIRAIVLSRTYQLSSQASGELRDADPENRLAGRHNRRRMDAESLRDSILLVSGQLDLQPGQGSAVAHLDVLVNKHGSLHQPSNHRSVYLCMLRNSPPAELAAFDLPDGVTVAGKRDETTLPTHALYLINSPFLVQQAEFFARRMLAAEAEDAARVRWAFHRALNREPSDGEMRGAIELVRAIDADLLSHCADAELRSASAWAALCQAILASNEFRYVD